MQVYNILTNSWTDETELMPVVDNVTIFGWADAAVCSDSQTGKIYVVNGVDGSFLYAALQIYDPSMPAGSRWTSGSYPQLANGDVFYSQDSGCAVMGSGASKRVYLFSGYAVVGSESAQVTKHTWEYNPATDTWADTGKNMLTGRLWGAYTNSSAYAFFAGGTDNLSTFVPVDSVERFSPASGWAAVTGMGAGQGRLANGLNMIGTTLAQYGGATYSGGFFLEDETLICGGNGACASWGPTPAPGGSQLGTPRWFAAWGYAGPKYAIYAGGDDGSTTVATTETLRP
jgi:hypothetical protein